MFKVGDIITGRDFRTGKLVQSLLNITEQLNQKKLWSLEIKKTLKTLLKTI